MSRTFTCAHARPHLHSFADGELRGEVLREMSQHVEYCESCADRVEEIYEMGSLLRDGATFVSEQLVQPDLAGLADGAVSRIRAEDRQSWRAMWERATDDFHWVMVGVGSLAAAFVSTLIVSMVVQSAIRQSDDSLAAVLKLASAPPELRYTTVVPTSLASMMDDDGQFAGLARVNDDGHVMSLELLPNLDRVGDKEATLLMTELRRLKFQQQGERRMTDPTGRRFVWLVSTTEVRAKAL